MSDFILPLTDASPGRVSETGQKAAGLGELANAGFAVPDGLVLTTRAFDRFLAENRRDPKDTGSAARAAKIPGDVLLAIRKIAADLGESSLAVRSSAVAEDLPGASFAGQYESVLGVRGVEQLESAILECWRSAFAPRVRAYVERRGGDAPIRMAVLIQRLIPARAAGVAFTANPVTGARDEVVVNAVRGLGDRMASGAVTPEDWVVRGGQAVCVNARQGALNPDEAAEVGKLAREVESHFGMPQDVEWALAGSELFVIQARPITALTPPEVPVAVDVPGDGFWQRDVAHFPKPVSPMYRSYKMPMMTQSVKKLAEEFGLLLDSVEFREIGGWDYSRVVPMGGRDRAPPPAWVISFAIRVVPSLRRRIKRQVEVVRSGLCLTYVDRWAKEWKPELIRRSTALLAVDLSALSDDALQAHLDSVLEYVQLAVDVHFRYLTVPGIVPLGQLVFAVRDLLGWDESRALELVSGLSETSSEPGLRMRELVRAVQSDDSLKKLLENPSRDVLKRIESSFPEFYRDFEAYRYAYGHRALSYDVCDPTLAEMPELLFGLIRSQLASAGADPSSATTLRRKDLEREAFARLASRPDELCRFDAILKAARLAYPTVDDNTFYTQSLGDALARYALIEFGRRLVGRNRLADPEDVFFFTLGEARGALREPRDLRTVAMHRKGERIWALGHPGPAFYGKPPAAPPPLDALPPEARAVSEALLWALAAVSTKPDKAASATDLRGVAGSPGSYSGPVRVIRDESEFTRLQQGEVLVCTTTTPVWSVLFPNAGAVVTEAGGTLSHPAIIAREYRIPAVLGIVGATEILRDGDRVVVDGTKGTVSILSASEAHR